MGGVRKAVVTVVGAALLAAGLVMMVTPGPGLVGLVAGLAVLATEWAWAERWLQVAGRKLGQARGVGAADPRARRRLRIGGLAAALVATAATAYVAVRDWPRWTVAGWDRAQTAIGFLPELPGM